MNEQEFLEEHPNIIKENIAWLSGIGWLELNVIHSTQIDKQKIKEIISNMTFCIPRNRVVIDTELTKQELLKELGLK